LQHGWKQFNELYITIKTNRALCLHFDASFLQKAKGKAEGHIAKTMIIYALHRKIAII